MAYFFFVATVVPSTALETIKSDLPPCSEMIMALIDSKYTIRTWICIPQSTYQCAILKSYTLKFADEKASGRHFMISMKVKTEKYKDGSHISFKRTLLPSFAGHIGKVIKDRKMRGSWSESQPSSNNKNAGYFFATTKFAIN